MLLHRAILIFSILILNYFCASAQKTGIAYWDLDHLYDTVPALFYNDTDYTPDGRLAWDSARYRRKIVNTAAVIDSMRLPLVALWGVENEAVVRDIVAACEGDYSYLHRTLNFGAEHLDHGVFAVGVIFRTYFRGDREARGDGDADEVHLREVGTLATEQFTHFAVAFGFLVAEGVDPFYVCHNFFG